MFLYVLHTIRRLVLPYKSEDKKAANIAKNKKSKRLRKKHPDVYSFLYKNTK